MRKSLILFATASATLALSACSEAGGDPAATEAADIAAPSEGVQSEPFAADAADSASTSPAIPALGSIPVSLPQLAYLYDYRWRMPGAEISALQRRHASLCEQQGPTVCQIIGMTKSGEDEGVVSGELRMAVATRQARAFGALLEDEAQDAGAEQIAAEIASEELSKQLVDTQARLRARTELRDRLQEVLRTRKGSVEELVEAERSVASVNEEIDQARSWLNEMQGRVAYSKVTVHYETGIPVTSDFLGPVTGALGSLGSIFGYLAAILILVGSVAVPVGGIWWANLVVRRRLSAAGANPA